MARVQFATQKECGSSVSAVEGVDISSAQVGEPLIFNQTTSTYVPFSQADIASQAAYTASFSAPAVVPPSVSLP